MQLQNLVYLFLLFVFAVIPLTMRLLLKIRFVGKLKYMLPASVFTGALFVLWDLSFSELGIWSFNPDFLTGIEIFRLPAEEWLMFLVIPVSGFYIYEWLKIRVEHFEKPGLFVAFSLVLLVLFGLTAYFFRQKLYPFFTFFLLAIYFGYNVFRNRFKKNYTKFYLAFFLLAVPFFIFSVIQNMLPLKIYESKHILGFSVLGMPIESLAYLFLLFFMNVTIYEYLKEREFY